MPGLTIMLDAVAALRETMQTNTPDPIAAAALAELAGVDGIGVYLREDRRYTQERDLRLLRQTIHSRLILHMAATSEMVGIALDIKPERVVLVPRLREDAPTEFGMDLLLHGKELFETVDTLRTNGINVSICVVPKPEQAKLVHQLRADWILVNTERLRAASAPATQKQELNKIIDTIKMANKLRLRIAVGGGLDYRLVKLFQGVNEIDEISMGRSLIARGVLKGLGAAVSEINTLLRYLK
jgi:pyridoxine 5-phosphate synthase